MPDVRIVSLLPSATEIVYALGLGDALVGVTHECDYPAEAREKPVLTRSDIVGEPREGETVAAAIDRQVNAEVGHATDTAVRAADEVAALRARAAALRARTRDRRAPRTLVLEWTDPPMGSGHWTPHLVEIAGGRPVLGWNGEYSRVISWDEIADADPECIIVAPCGMDLAATRASIADLRRTSTAWRAIAADPTRRVVAIDGHQFANRPGPRLIDTAELFAEAIHPGLVSVTAAQRERRSAMLMAMEASSTSLT